MTNNKFYLPKGNDNEGISWESETDVANFIGITVSKVKRPSKIVVKESDKPIKTGTIRFPYDESFKINYEQKSAAFALAQALGSVGGIIGDAAGKGIDEAAKRIEQEMIRLLKPIRFIVRVKSTVNISRQMSNIGDKESNLGDEDMFILADARSQGFASYAAGQGMIFTISTTLEGALGQRPTSKTGNNSKSEQTVKINSKSKPLGEKELRANDQLVFRLQNNGSKDITVIVKTTAQFDSVFPKEQSKQLIEAIKNALKSEPRVSKNDRILKKEDDGYNIGAFWRGGKAIIDALSELIVDSFTTRVLALKVEQTELTFTSIPKDRLEKRFGIKEVQLSFLDSPQGQQLVALANSMEQLKSQSTISDSAFRLFKSLNLDENETLGCEETINSTDVPQDFLESYWTLPPQI